MSIAIKRAVKGGDVHIIQDYLQNNEPVEIYWSVYASLLLSLSHLSLTSLSLSVSLVVWQVVRLMLLKNKSYDPVLLGLSQWICRRWYVMAAHRKHTEKYHQSSNSHLTSALHLPSSEGPIDPLDRVFEFVMDCIGLSDH
jgi:hypothetical protein